jgi:hypothetical protein
MFESPEIRGSDRPKTFQKALIRPSLAPHYGYFPQDPGYFDVNIRHLACGYVRVLFVFIYIPASVVEKKCFFSRGTAMGAAELPIVDFR